MKEVCASVRKGTVQLRTYVPAVFRFPHESARNSCLHRFYRTKSCGKSQWNRAENSSTSAWISASACTGKSRNSLEKCKLSVSSTVHMYVHIYVYTRLGADIHTYVHMYTYCGTSMYILYVCTMLGIVRLSMRVYAYMYVSTYVYMAW